MDTYVIMCNSMVMSVAQTKSDSTKPITEHLKVLQQQDYDRNPWHWESECVRTHSGKGPFEYFKHVNYWRANLVPLTIIEGKADE